MPAQAELGRGTLVEGIVVMALGSRPWWNPTHRKVRDEWGTRLSGPGEVFLLDIPSYRTRRVPSSKAVTVCPGNRLARHLCHASRRVMFGGSPLIACCGASLPKSKASVMSRVRP